MDWCEKVKNAKRILICGSRNWVDRETMENVFKHIDDSIIIEGQCKGADLMAAELAEGKNLCIERYPANWEKYGRSAGPIRNQQMIKIGKPDIVLVFHEALASSRGTKNMMKYAKEVGITTFIFTANK